MFTFGGCLFDGPFSFHDHSAVITFHRLILIGCTATVTELHGISVHLSRILLDPFNSGLSELCEGVDQLAPAFGTNEIEVAHF